MYRTIALLIVLEILCLRRGEALHKEAILGHLYGGMDVLSQTLRFRGADFSAVRPKAA